MSGLSNKSDVHPKAAFGAMNPRSRQWLGAHGEDLRNGDIPAVVRSLKLRPSGLEEKEVVRKAIDYVEKNRVVEAGCKTVIGRRLKQSEMRWTVKGANSIIALRCCQMTGEWENCWEARVAR